MGNFATFSPFVQMRSCWRLRQQTRLRLDKSSSTTKVASYKRTSWASWQFGDRGNPAKKQCGRQGTKTAGGTIVRPKLAKFAWDLGERGQLRQPINSVDEWGAYRAPTRDALPSTCLTTCQHPSIDSCGALGDTFTGALPDGRQRRPQGANLYFIDT